MVLRQLRRQARVEGGRVAPERLERDRRQDDAAHPEHDVQNHEAARLLGNKVEEQKVKETPLPSPPSGGLQSFNPAHAVTSII